MGSHLHTDEQIIYTWAYFTVLSLYLMLNFTQIQLLTCQFTINTAFTVTQVSNVLFFSWQTWLSWI